MELVTAIITTHKRPPEIVERAINSVLSQTYKNIELIVVDDSPVDYELRENVGDMLQKYVGDNVKYIKHEVCQGACVARNTGLAEAKGKFVGYLDDDDEWCSNKIEKMLPAFEDETVALVYCGSITKNDDTNLEEVRSVPIYNNYVFDELIKGNFIGSTSFPLMRTEVLREAGGFDPLQQSAQDYDVWLKISSKYKVFGIDEGLVIYHIHAGEQISKSSSKRVNGLERLNEKHIEYLNTHKDAYWIRNMKMVPMYAMNKQYRKAFKSWFKSMWKKPFAFKGNIKYLYIFFRTILAKK